MLDPTQHVSADHLADYLRGELDVEHEEGVETHIGSCLVCARRLQEEAQLEVLLHDAYDEVVTPMAAGRRRAMWQRVAATVANTAAAAAALLMVITPGQPLTSTTRNEADPAAAFVNDALCFPSSTPAPSDEDCEDGASGGAMMAMVTDPDDYLSPFDEPSSRGAAVCSVEDLACEPG